MIPNNHFEHFCKFYNKIVKDKELYPTHISLYLALYQSWLNNYCINPISIHREEIMQISKIYSKATYLKCIKDLHKKGLIIYKPSFNPFLGSQVTLISFLKTKKANKNDKRNQ